MDSPIKIAIEPERAMQFESVSVSVTGLDPGARVKISSFLVDDAGQEWGAYGWFVADADGVVDVDSAPSEGGTYIGVDGEGLVWSMRPSGVDGRQFLKDAKAPGHFIGRPHFDDALSPITIAMAAETTGGQRSDCSLVLDRMAEGLEAHDLRDGRLRGRTYRWADRTRSRGAVMSLTGSSGGLETSYAPLIASLGYDVLSLAYFAFDDLPEAISSIPLEYFEEGIDWARKEFNVDRIGVQGGSRGGELALLLAATFPDKIAAIVPMVPMFATCAAWGAEGAIDGPSWTYRGEAIPYVVTHSMTMEEMFELGEASPTGYAATPDYQRDFENLEVRESCAIPIERAQASILLISGEDDQMWPSRWASEVVINRLRARGYRLPYSHLALSDAGHLISPPNTITAFSAAVYHPIAKVFLACGGSSHGAARAGRQAWSAIAAHYEAAFTD